MGVPLERIHPVIREIVQSFIQAVREIAEVRYVILFGSVSKKEYSLCEIDGRIELFSDVEFIIVTKSMKNDTVRAIKQIAANIESRYFFRTPFFHIDFSCLTVNQLRKIPTILRHYELRETGIVVYGDPRIIHLIPETTINNLRLKDLNGLLIERLWQLYLFMPKQEAEVRELLNQTTRNYLLCRNLLELSTILLPQAGILLPTYSKRVEYIQEHYKKMDFAEMFGERFLDDMQTALTGKIDMQFRDVDGSFYGRVIDYFKNAYDYLSQKQKGVFSRWDMRDKYLQVKYMAKNPSLRLKWLFSDKSEQLFKLLIALHQLKKDRIKPSKEIELQLEHLSGRKVVFFNQDFIKYLCGIDKYKIDKEPIFIKYMEWNYV
jgi:hypothetical protein